MKFNSDMSAAKAAVIGLMLLVLAVSCFGQKEGDGVRRSVETGVDQYELGPGDVLDVRIFNRPLLSRDSVRVDDRGMISLPLINEIKASCRTESELADAIGQAYLEYLKNPHVEVFIKDYQSKPVVVVGAVKEPGRFQMQRRVHLIEIISIAGGLTEQAAGRIQVTHSADRPGCSSTSEGESVEWYEMKDLLANSPGGGAIVQVRPGDTINLLEADKIYVIGNVTNPVAIPLKQDVTISQAIAMAGGALPASKLDEVRVTRQPPGSPRSEFIVNLNAVKRNSAEDIRLQGNDIVEVRTSTGKKIIQSLLNSIAPSVSRLPVRVIP